MTFFTYFGRFEVAAIGNEIMVAPMQPMNTMRIDGNSVKRNTMLMPCIVALRNTPITATEMPISEPFSMVPPWIHSFPGIHAVTQGDIGAVPRPL